MAEHHQRFPAAQPVAATVALLAAGLSALIGAFPTALAVIALIALWQAATAGRPR